MDAPNLFIQFTNGAVANYLIEVQSELKQFLEDYATFLSAPRTQPVKAKTYHLVQDGKPRFAVIDFATVGSVSITDDGSRPAP